jgi:hypothetical protein
MTSMPEIQQARVALPGGTSPERAERVSRLIFDHLQRTLDRDRARTEGAPRVVPHLVVPPLELEWESMDDEGIARAGAAWIYRWIKATE